MGAGSQEGKEEECDTVGKAYPSCSPRPIHTQSPFTQEGPHPSRTSAHFQKRRQSPNHPTVVIRDPVQTTRRDYRGISDSVVYRSQNKPIGIDYIVVELTRRVNDFKTVYFERKRKSVESATTVVSFDGEEKVEKSLEVFGRSTRLYIVVPFLCPFYVLLLVLSHIIFGVGPFSLVVALVPTSQL